ncbi:MAG: iron-sulfur cluster assembly accessory protein, partial [Candidatus Omnitrophica bacterium]|nr:iron-sulfur cluster assembly accessory protein [Candidatus Omnitrophota bacterium]
MTKINQENSQMQDKPLLTLTDSAIEKVRSMMAKEGKEGAGLRVSVVTGGCAGLSYDMRFQRDSYENDIVFEQKGLRVFVNPESAPFLKGINIDYVDTLKESGFKYHNPNAKGSCGCGT